MDAKFDAGELRVLRWAVMVAADAVTIQASTGQMETDDGNHVISALSAMEEKLNTLLAED